jgi:hypothetical protein
VVTKPEPSSRPPKGELPDKVTLLKDELEVGRLRLVPGSLETRGERFEAFRSMLWHLTSFFQGALKHQNQIDLIAQATRLAQRALIDEAFDKDGLVAYAKQQLPLQVDPKSLKRLQQQIQKLALGAYADLDDALESASTITPAYWDWVAENPKADPVEINPHQQLYVPAIGRVKRCLFTYSFEFGEAVDILVVTLELVQDSPGTA